MWTVLTTSLVQVLLVIFRSLRYFLINYNWTMMKFYYQLTVLYIKVSN